MTSPSSYLDFDLLIEAADQGYHARVVHSPAGQAELDFTLPFSDQDLQMLVLQMFRLSSRSPVRAIASPELREVRAFGTRLYGAVFDGPVGASLIRSIDEAKRAGAGLRIRLHLDDAPALASVPWELLYDSATDDFLCLSDQTPLLRYMDLAEAAGPLAVAPPLRILAVVSSPAGFPPLDVQKEWTNVATALKGPGEEGRVALERLETPTLEALQGRLRRQDFHVLHFIGHGAFDENSEDGVLLFEDLEGKGDAVTGESLGVLLNDHESLRLVVLNACEGARTSATDPFAGTAQSLVRKGVPAVIAMQFEVTDVAAMALSAEFYGALADGWPVDAALSEARKAVFTRVNAVEWATPVLYMRAPDGRIFDIVAPPAEPVATTPPPVQDEPAPDTTGGAEKEPTDSKEHEEPAKPKVPATSRKRLAAYGAVGLVVLVLLVLALSALGNKSTPNATGPSGPATGAAGSVAVPPIEPASYQTTADQLEQAGLKPARVERPSRTVPAGTVSALDPPAGTNVAPGTVVTAYVSSGSWIAYITNKNDPNSGTCNNDTCNWDVYVMRPNGKQARPLVTTPNADMWPSWSPDGSKIAYASSAGGNFDIYVMDSSGTGTATQITRDFGRCLFPTWSRDGSQIAFSSDRSGNDDIYVMNADGSGVPRQLTSDPLDEQGPRWSPTRDEIAYFQVQADGHRQVFLMDLVDGVPHNLSNSDTNDLGPAWSPDGNRLAFNRDSSVWIMDRTDPGNASLFIDEEAVQPTWSPDGASIAFRRSEDIWVVDLDGSNLKDLTPTPGSNEERPVW